MSDDMFLLNIDTSGTSTGGVSSKATTSTMKGNWKQKRQMVKKMRKKQPKTNEVNTEQNGLVNMNAELFNNRNAKVDKKKKNKKEQGKPNPGYKGKGDKKDDTFVSSLFSSNKEIKTKVVEEPVIENDDVSKDEVKEEDKEPLDVEKEDITKNNELFDDQETSAFVDLGIKSPKLVKALNNKLKIETPTRIQSLGIPKIIRDDQKNIFIHSRTGSGKTLTYLLPIYETILRNTQNLGRKSGCTGIIITPTRELAAQLEKIINTSLNIGPSVQAVVLIGGEKKQSEKKRLRKGFNILIGTPGRLLDHFKTTESVKEYIKSSSLKYLVMDEGDRLMELGFQKDLKDIFMIIKDEFCGGNDKSVKKILCSATTGKDGKLGEFINLKDYQMITANSKDEEELTIANSKISETLVQDCVIVPPKLRLATLAGVINNTTIEHSKEVDSEGNVILRTMVFLSCSDSVDFHFNIFSGLAGNKYINRIEESIAETKTGSNVLPSLNDDNLKDFSYVFYKLHGSLHQSIRSKTLQHFGSNKAVVGKNVASNKAYKKHLVMFCTDVASRGLDLPHITKVIEYDPPFTIEDHIHRVGRTARLSATQKVKGEATIFLLPGEEEGYLAELNKLHDNKIQSKGYESVLKKAFLSNDIKRNDYDSKNERKGKTAKANSWDSNVTTWHMNVERMILEKEDLKKSATNGFISHIRAYTTHIAREKKYFNVKFIHLGHLCKSFGLREKPKQLAYTGNTNKKVQRKRKFGDISDNESGEEFQMDSEDEDFKRDTKLKNMSNKNKMFELSRMALKDLASEFHY